MGSEGLSLKRSKYKFHRSGNIMDLQPKAPGSSLLNKLTQYLVRDMLRHSGLKVRTREEEHSISY